MVPNAPTNHTSFTLSAQARYRSLPCGSVFSQQKPPGSHTGPGFAGGPLLTAGVSQRPVARLHTLPLPHALPLVAQFWGFGSTYFPNSWSHPSNKRTRQKLVRIKDSVLHIPPGGRLRRCELGRNRAVDGGAPGTLARI